MGIESTNTTLKDTGEFSSNSQRYLDQAEVVIAVSKLNFTPVSLFKSYAAVQQQHPFFNPVAVVTEISLTSGKAFVVYLKTRDNYWVAYDDRREFMTQGYDDDDILRLKASYVVYMNPVFDLPPPPSILDFCK